MTLTRVLVVASAAIGLAALSVAQPGPGQGRGMMMGGGGGLMPVSFTLARQDVQDELKLTSDQKTQLETLRTEAMNKMRESFQPGQPPSEESRKAMQKIMDESSAKITTILTPEQNKRLQEIRIQIAGNNAVYDKDVAKSLGVTSDQDAKLKALQQKLQDANRQVMENTQDWGERRELMQKNREVFRTEVDKVLTETQRTKLKEMGGAHFEQKDQPRGFGGFGRG